MKNYLLFIIVTLHYSLAAQVSSSDLHKALNEGDAIKAKQLADKAILETKNQTDAAIWYYRGQIYLAIFGSPDRQIQQLSTNALEIAYEAFLKTLELDKNKTYNKETISALQSIASQFNYEGANLFNQKNYTKSLEYFENAIKINKMPAINKIDTIVIYNAALAAEKANKVSLAIQYYETLKQLKFGGAQIYIELSKLYQNYQNNSLAEKVLKEGLGLFPNESFQFYSELINFYLKNNRTKDVLLYTDQALKEFPTNPTLYFIKASLTEQSGNEKEAEQLYKKTLEYDPKYQDALYNLGAMYYNRATTLIKKAMNKTEQNQAIEIYKQAQPYLETYVNEYQKDEVVLKMLKTIYTLTNQTDKLNQVNIWLQN
ncbi:MAG: hypothetical protein N2449_07485 [Bacteroidales bacterium]|nr:hypothetical protein [Bacteroidales bacterium]